MTDADKLAMLKVMTDTSRFTDAQLSSFLTMAGKEIITKAYPYDNTVDTVPGRYEYLQIKIAAYFVDKFGASGETSHSENGISRVYESADVPPSMLRAIVPYCGAIRNEHTEEE